MFFADMVLPTQVGFVLSDFRPQMGINVTCCPDDTGSEMINNTCPNNLMGILLFLQISMISPAA
jgi:hypothetical protein